MSCTDEQPDVLKITTKTKYNKCNFRSQWILYITSMQGVLAQLDAKVVSRFLNTWIKKHNKNRNRRKSYDYELYTFLLFEFRYTHWWDSVFWSLVAKFPKLFIFD